MAEYTNEAVGGLIREARERRGISQAELAKILGVKQQSVSKWEAGESRPRPGLLLAIEAALGLKIQELAALQEAYYPIGTDRRDGTDAGDQELAADDDEIEIDYNAVMAEVPEHVRRAVIELVRPEFERMQREREAER